MSRGRRSLVIGVLFLVACLGVRQLIDQQEAGWTHILREGLLIVGWVAMWGPIDIFLYGWWPIAARRRQFAHLTKIDIEVRALR